MFNPPPTPYDVSFHFLGFPVRIHPFFWVIAVVLGMPSEIGNMKSTLVDLAVWTAAVFVAIMVHELGHGLAFRYVFGVRSMIVLHGTGGVTVPFVRHQRKRGILGFFSEVFLSAAGVLAGFLLVLLIFAFFLLIHPNAFLNKGVLGDFFYQLGLVCIVWGVLNLLPIYPLDGGHIAREVFCLISPRSGAANSLVLSIVVAVLVAVFWVRIGVFWNAALFAYLAYLSWQALERS